MSVLSGKVPLIRKSVRIPSLSAIRIERIVMVFLIAFIILDGNTMWSYVLHSPIYGQGFGWATGTFSLLVILLSGKFPKDSRTVITLLFLVGALGFYALATRYKTTSFISHFVIMFVCLYLLSASLYENRNMGFFLKTYSNIMMTIAVISLFFWIFGSLLNVLPGRREVTYFWADKYNPSYTYYYLYFENPLQNRGEAISRNLGVFPEAPGYACFLTLGMLIDVVRRKDLMNPETIRKNTYRLLIWFITLLSTGSSKGIIIVLAVIALKYLFRKSNRPWKQVLKSITCIILFLAASAASIYVLEGKLSTGSGAIRIDDLQAGLKTWQQHPLFGAGYMNGDAIRANWKLWRDNEGLSMGLAVLLGYGGLFFLVLYFGAAVFAYKGDYFHCRKKEWIMVIVVLFTDLFISNGAFELLYIFIIAAAYASRRSRPVDLVELSNDILSSI